MHSLGGFLVVHRFAIEVRSPRALARSVALWTCGGTTIGALSMSGSGGSLARPRATRRCPRVKSTRNNRSFEWTPDVPAHALLQSRSFSVRSWRCTRTGRAVPPPRRRYQSPVVPRLAPRCRAPHLARQWRARTRSDPAPRRRRLHQWWCMWSGRFVIPGFFHCPPGLEQLMR